MKRAAAAALAVVLMAGCAGGVRKDLARTVVVEGWAPIGSLPRPEARRRALADAQRRAVEQAAGVEVASVSVVDDASRVRERVSTAARGTVTSFKVLRETVVDGVLRLTVRAEVERLPGSARGRIGWIHGSGPRAAVTVAAPDAAAAESAKDAFLAGWTSYGGSTAAADAEGDFKLRLAASESVIVEPRLRPFVSVRVRLAATASDAAGGAVWAASRESAALGADSRAARERALKDAGAALAKAAAEDLPARLWLTARRGER